MKLFRISNHAEKEMIRREVDRAEVLRALEQPDKMVPGDPPRQIFMRRYFDETLQVEMLLRVVVEETPAEIVVVTLYKTSKFRKYLKGENA